MNYMPQNPYFGQFQNNMANPYQPAFFNYPMPNFYAQQHAQNQQPTQQQTQPAQQPQQITTQPPILQPKNGINNEILSVANREEAIGFPVDLIHGRPSFFYNKSNGEIYLKQFDVPTGSAIFKVFNEIKQEQPMEEQEQSLSYKKELDYISNGIDNLHRMVANLQAERKYPINIDKVEAETIEIENEQPTDIKGFKTKKRGQ